MKNTKKFYASDNISVAVLLEDVILNIRQFLRVDSSAHIIADFDLVHWQNQAVAI